MEESYRVSTPENITFSFDIAGIGSRFMAALVDLLIYGSVSLAIGLIAAYIVSRTDNVDLIGVFTAIYIGVNFVMYWAYYMVFEILWGGQSPGKRILKLRVVRLDGTPASAGQIVIRNVGRLVDIFPGFYAVGVVVMFLNDQSRRLGDLAAGTLVVREGQPVTLKQLTSPPPATVLSDAVKAEAATLPLNRLNKEQRQVVHTYMQRRSGMSETQRAKLAMEIGQAVARQMDVIQPTHPAQAEYLLEMIDGA
jgi:uncharacterized RDD family membrane protein YckC